MGMPSGKGRSGCLLIITGLFMLPPGELQATEYHVAQSHAAADDSGRGTPERPLKTIGRAAALVRPGDVVRIHSGVYREKVAITQSGTKDQPIRFEAAPGASVTITGADLLTGWVKEQDDAYSVPWPHELDQGDSRNPNPGGVEQVFVNCVLLRKAPGLKELAEGTFFIDSGRKRLYLRAKRNPDEDRARLPVEGSTRSEIWVVPAAYVHTRGLRFRYAANRGQQGMAQFRGKNAVVEDCIFEWSNSSGAFFWADDVTVLRCTFQDNGQQGFSAYRADRLRLDGCTVQRNNVKGFPREWEAGGNKICCTRGAVLENSRFLRNHGSGVWFDISNVDCTVRNCLIADNEDAGIFYEISYSLRAHDNVIIGNGLAETKGAWGADGGICLSSSPGCVVERNLLVGNRQGFCFREQNRTTPPIDGAPGPEVAIWNHDEVIRDNFIADNRTAQVQGWFDIATERHWPRAMQTGQGKGGKAGEDVAAGNQAAKDGVPAGLSLEDLKITFEGNIYSLQPSQPFFIWGTNWKRRQEFRDIPSLTKALGFEGQRGRIHPPFPVDIARRDLRLPKDHPALVNGAYPRGKVPDCLLGEEARLQEATAGVEEAAAKLQAAQAKVKEAEAAAGKAQSALKESQRLLKAAMEAAVAAGLDLAGVCPHCQGKKGAMAKSASLGIDVWEDCRKCSGTGKDGSDLLQTVRKLEAKVKEDEGALGTAKDQLRIAEADPAQANLDQAKAELEKVKTYMEKARATLPPDNKPMQGESK